jgi:hypothetical protein
MVFDRGEALPASRDPMSKIEADIRRLVLQRSVVVSQHPASRIAQQMVS